MRGMEGWRYNRDYLNNYWNSKNTDTGGAIVYGKLKLVSCSIIYWDFVRRLRNENKVFYIVC